MHSEALLGAPEGVAEAGHRLVEDEDEPELVGEGAEALQEPRARPHEALPGLRDDRGHLAARVPEHPLGGREVVVGGDEDGLRDAPRDAVRVGGGLGVGGRVGRAVAPHRVVVVAVVGPLELDDLLAPGERAREPERHERRLRSSRRVADEVRAGDDLLELRRVADGGHVGDADEMRREVDLLLDRGPDPRMVVAEEEGAAPAGEVDELAPRRVEEVRPPPVGEDERALVRQAVAGEDAAGQALRRLPQKLVLALEVEVELGRRRRSRASSFYSSPSAPRARAGSGPANPRRPGGPGARSVRGGPNRRPPVRPARLPLHPPPAPPPRPGGTPRPGRGSRRGRRARGARAAPSPRPRGGSAGARRSRPARPRSAPRTLAVRARREARPGRPPSPPRRPRPFRHPPPPRSPAAPPPA